MPRPRPDSPTSVHRAKATTLPPTGERIRPQPQGAAAGYRVPTHLAFAFVLALRILNALTVRTFFQPDEYFQSLEPAWRIAFGPDSGAWITWEWRTQLRSSLHPGIFAGVYQVAAKLASLLNLSLPARAELLIAAPKAAQAVFAALLDCYTWKFAETVYGRGSRTALTALALSICSPWQWFCSTRTLSNCVETAITAIAVYYWPWKPSATTSDAARDKEPRNRDTPQPSNFAGQDILGPTSHLRLSLLLAAFACILRPTNLLIWLCISIPTLWQASTRQRYILVREILLCGTAVLLCSCVSDRLYYHVWTLPPLQFVYFNLVQSLAVFYGRNRGDYYLTEGLPLLLTTALPFAAVGIWQALRASPTQGHSTSNSAGELFDTHSLGILSPIAWTTIIMTLSLSVISHKEVRFLYPVLPFLHILSARPLAAFSTPLTPSRKAILSTLFILNLLIAGYTSQIHQRGVVDVLSYLRHKHEARNAASATKTTVGFLMPCHSTPWRSHLVHPGISAWALTCEPPVNVPLAERDQYLDEADQFYIQPGPAVWLEQNMHDVRAFPVKGRRSVKPGHVVAEKRRRMWPQNLVFFEHLEETMKDFLGGSRYQECWRGFNTHFHDDTRRTGDVIVWCLDKVS